MSQQLPTAHTAVYNTRYLSPPRLSVYTLSRLNPSLHDTSLFALWLSLSSFSPNPTVRIHYAGSHLHLRFLHAVRTRLLMSRASRDFPASAEEQLQLLTLSRSFAPFSAGADDPPLRRPGSLWIGWSERLRWLRMPSICSIMMRRCSDIAER